MNGQTETKGNYYRLRIHMDLSCDQVDRVITIPAEASFYELAQTILITFGWSGSHEHEFMIPEGYKYFDFITPADFRPVKTLILKEEDPELLDQYDPSEYEIRYEHTTKIYEAFQETDKIVFTYDFGDNWDHMITLEEVLEEGEDHPVLLERIGTRPPEDIGGEDGYLEYRNIVSNPYNMEREAILAWARETKEPDRSMEEINELLSKIKE